MTQSSVEQRLARLEAIEAIKALKYRYLRACDGKQPEAFRSCFIREGAVLDYGPQIGRSDADDIAATFERIALHRVDGHYVIFDMHHAMHPDIRITTDTTAEGSWTLRFRQVSVAEGLERVSAIEYADRYAVEDGEWRISRCEVTTLWTISRSLPEGYTISGSLT